MSPSKVRINNQHCSLKCSWVFCLDSSIIAMFDLGQVGCLNWTKLLQIVDAQSLNPKKVMAIGSQTVKRMEQNVKILGILMQ